MPTFTNPVADADELYETARGLAHATRLIDETCDVHRVLARLSSTLASLSQSLHQLATFHNSDHPGPGLLDGDPRSGRAASYQAAWELYRSAEMLHQVAAAVDRAQAIQATITYEPAPSGHRLARRAAPDAGVSL